MDAVQPEPLSTRAHQGHTLSIGFGLLLLGVAGLGLSAGPHIPTLGWIGLSTPVLIVLYFVAMRVVFTHEQHRRAREVQEVADGLQYAEIRLQEVERLTRTAVGNAIARIDRRLAEDA